MWRIFNALFPFGDFVYILQLEEYSIERYLKWLRRFFFRRNIQKRQQLVYTVRARLLLVASVVAYGVLGVIALTHHAFPVALILIVLLTVFIPIEVLIVNALLAALLSWVHAARRREAAHKLATHRAQLRVVMVAGSYGKTTTKGFIEQLCKHQFRVQVPPGNTNTPSGIASWILGSLKSDTTLVIIEADGYNQKEYEQTVIMSPADIVVITNIGDQHLERFGTRVQLAEAIAQVFAWSQSSAHLVSTPAVFEDLKSVPLGDRVKHPIVSNPLVYRGTEIDALHLSASQREDLALAFTVADMLDIPERFVLDAVKNLSVPERRQLRGQLYGYEAIDDSYNISVSTALAAVVSAKEAARAVNKKLLVVTAGIPELGPEIADGNIQLGELLAKNADHAVVLGSIFASDISTGFGQAAERHGVSETSLDTPCPKPNDLYTCLLTLKEFQTLAHSQWNPSEWFLLLLPELNDLYY